MNRAESLQRLFHYEVWAMAQWAPVIESWENPTAHLIWEHLQKVPGIWAERMTRTTMDSREAVDAWLAAIGAHAADLDVPMDYQNFAGDPFTSAFSDIANHVVIHGAYHRGQLRALAEADGITWPETDFIRFARVAPL